MQWILSFLAPIPSSSMHPTPHAGQMGSFTLTTAFLTRNCPPRQASQPVIGYWWSLGVSLGWCEDKSTAFCQNQGQPWGASPALELWVGLVWASTATTLSVEHCSSMMSSSQAVEKISVQTLEPDHMGSFPAGLWPWDFRSHLPCLWLTCLIGCWQG